MTGMSRVAASLLRLRQDVEALHLRHDHVEQDQIGLVLARLGQRVLAVDGGNDGVALLLQRRLAGLPEDPVVFGEQDALALMTGFPSSALDTRSQSSWSDRFDLIQ